MGLKEWAPIQEALGEKFSGGPLNVVGGERLSPIMDREQEYGIFLVHTYKGHDFVEHAFFEFLIETIDLAGQGAFRGQLNADDKRYVTIYLTFISVFRRFRAVATLKNYGHPVHGFALLRDLTSSAIQLGAVVGGHINILALQGLDPERESLEKLTIEQFRKIRESAKKASAKAIRMMVGRESGLDEEIINELEMLRDMFHHEVHGSLFSFAEDFRTIAVEQKLPQLFPQIHPKNMDAAMYMNRSCEAAWMVHKCLPYLQLAPRAFGKDWIEKWDLLDTALRMQVESLGEMGKPIGKIFPAMIDKKFGFNPDTHYQP